MVKFSVNSIRKRTCEDLGKDRAVAHTDVRWREESSSLHAFFKQAVMLPEAGLLDTADSFEDLPLPIPFLGGISILCFVLLGYGGQPEPTRTTRTHPKDRTRSLVN